MRVSTFASDPLRDPEPLIRRVYAYVAYRVGHGADAEDITSATFERALRHRNSYDPGRGSEVAWLIGIARRCIADAAARTVTVAEPSDDVDLADPEAATLDRLDMAAALARLGDRDREMLALRYGSDLTARQIAETFGMTTNAVEVALHRARRALGELLEGAAAAHDARVGAASAAGRRT